MLRTKGSKNHAKTDFDAQLAKVQKDKALLEEGIAKTAYRRQRQMCIRDRLEAKKSAAEAKAAEAAKKAEAEEVLKKLLASGMSADEILAKLK